jgi:hypothetical protein
MCPIEHSHSRSRYSPEPSVYIVNQFISSRTQLFPFNNISLDTIANLCLNIRLYALSSYGRANRVPPPDILFPSETLLQGHYSGQRRFVLKPELLARAEGAHEPSNVGFQFEMGHISLDSRWVVDEQRSYFEQAVTVIAVLWPL